MSNGIRQGSLLSPYLFNVYVDEHNIGLNNARVGCHIANKPVNNLSYADDLVVLATSVAGLNDLLSRCGHFANENYVTFSSTKSVAMCILPRKMKLNNIPKICLSENELEYVDSFNYLGHTITTDFSDDDDIKKEMRKMCARGNTLIRKFKF